MLSKTPLQAEPAADRADVQGVAVGIDGVVKTYATRGGEKVQAIESFNQHIASGEFISIVGPSGCGKSTLLMIVGGLLRCSQGTVTIDGTPVVKPHPDMAVVFQRDLLLKWRTVLDNILLPVEIKGLPPTEHRARATELMAQVGLKEFGGKYPDELSGGMRQRVAICRALVQRPPLLLMDEPFGALDALTREQMMVDLQRLWQRIRNTVLFVTHSIDESVFLSDRVLVMSPRPGKVDLDLTINLPRPRRLAMQASSEFLAHTAQIRAAFEARGVLTEE